MEIHFIRNATLIISTPTQRILVDPMLGDQDSMSPYAFFRHPSRRNPLVPLPPNAEIALSTITAALITHRHPDHVDNAGIALLAERQVPVYCAFQDAPPLDRRGLNVKPLRPSQRQEFMDGSVTPFPTEHGYGFMTTFMGPGVGYILDMPGQPSVYISGDTVLTPAVKRILSNIKPEIAILASGNASLDIGGSILMPIREQLEFIQLAPGTVVATHMEALNHCPVTREQLRAAVTQAGLIDKVRIPQDGDMLTF